VLTVRSLVDEMGLRLATGAEGADVPVRWVHSTELPDPTPFLSGGELLLTTGFKLSDARRQRAFVRRLVEHNLAGLGFGTGFDHKAVPKAVLDEARKAGFPVFEVPYELPFIAVTEKAFTRLVNEQYEVLQRGIATHKRLERLVLEERGLDAVVRALAAAIGGAVVVLGSRGETLASGAFRRRLGEGVVHEIRQEVAAREADGGEFAPEHPDIAGRSLVLPVGTARGGAPHAWLVAARDAGALGDFERLLLQQAVTVVALELMRQRAMRDTERRLAGDVLADAVDGRIDEHELPSRLLPFGVGETAAVLVFSAPEPAEVTLEAFLRDENIGALVATNGRLLCAVVDADEDLDTVALAERAAEEMAAEHGGEVRAGASRAASVHSLRRTFHEARCALEAMTLANGHANGRVVASWRDLGAFQLLLSVQDDQALRLYCDSVLGPLEGEAEYGDELIRSLEAFIEQNGQWERAARTLYCHRHTLRYRIRRVEELTGRDLSSARDRIEFWLALRGRELVK
jgi:PucR family transcriptional regulator, purine catabolism regulatory protein